MRRFIIAAISMLFVGASVFAQPATENPDPDPGGSGGSGYCKTCDGGTAGGLTCTNHYPGPYGAYGNYPGFTSCVAHNVCSGCQGPAYCEVSGSCTANDLFGPLSFETPRSYDDQVYGPHLQAEVIISFLRASRTMTASDVDDFVARVDYDLRAETWRDAERKRLVAYRAKFASLTGRDLGPGRIPVAPHKATKALAAKIAAGGRS